MCRVFQAGSWARRRWIPPLALRLSQEPLLLMDSRSNVSPLAYRTCNRQATRARGRKANLIEFQRSTAARRAKLPLIVIVKQAVGCTDLLPGRTASSNPAAHWVGAKPAIGGGYCASYTARVTVSAGNIKLRCY